MIITSGRARAIAATAAPMSGALRVMPTVAAGLMPLLLQRAFDGGEVFATDRIVVEQDAKRLDADHTVVIHDLFKLVGIAGAMIEQNAVEHTHRVGAGERKQERGTVLFGNRQGRA